MFHRAPVLNKALNFVQDSFKPGYMMSVTESRIEQPQISQPDFSIDTLDDEVKINEDYFDLSYPGIIDGYIRPDFEGAIDQCSKSGCLINQVPVDFIDARKL